MREIAREMLNNKKPLTLPLRPFSVLFLHPVQHIARLRYLDKISIFVRLRLLAASRGEIVPTIQLKRL